MAFDVELALGGDPGVDIIYGEGPVITSLKIKDKSIKIKKLRNILRH